MPPCLLEGHFQLPARNKPTDDLLRVSFKVGTQEESRGTANRPVEYHTAVCEAISTSRSLSPYQLAIVVCFQSVVDSSATTERLGRRSPFMRGLPICPRRLGGAGS